MISIDKRKKKYIYEIVTISCVYTNEKSINENWIKLNIPRLFSLFPKNTILYTSMIYNSTENDTFKATLLKSGRLYQVKPDHPCLYNL